MERFIKGYLRWLIISIYYWNVYPRVFALIDHLHLSLKRISKGISVGWSPPPTMERFIQGYFNSLITFINYRQVYPKVFPLVDHFDILLKRLSKGISVGWSPPSTIERFIQGYFHRLLISIYYRKVYPRVFQLVHHLDQLSKGLSKEMSDGWSYRSSTGGSLKGICNVWTLSWTTKRVPHKVV